MYNIQIEVNWALNKMFTTKVLAKEIIFMVIFFLEIKIFLKKLFD